MRVTRTIRGEKEWQLSSRSNFLRVRIIIIKMQIGQLALSVLILVAIANANQANVQATPFQQLPLNKGLTFQATVFPSYENNWAGRFSCNNCNPFEGDQPCTKALPILCISNAKTLSRPYYRILT